MSTLARRTLPADPNHRAALIAERLRAITGRQEQVVVCWCCAAEYAEASDRYHATADGIAVCKDQDGCNDRAARAGLVLVMGDPGGAAS